MDQTTLANRRKWRLEHPKLVRKSRATQRKRGRIAGKAEWEPLVRTKAPKTTMLRQALMQNPLAIQRELNNRSLYEFMQYFWDLVSPHKFSPNWHIELLCKELETVAEKVGGRSEERRVGKEC
jgi:hypothetical protein